MAQNECFGSKMSISLACGVLLAAIHVSKRLNYSYKKDGTKIMLLYSKMSISVACGVLLAAIHVNKRLNYSSKEEGTKQMLCYHEMDIINPSNYIHNHYFNTVRL